MAMATRAMAAVMPVVIDFLPILHAASATKATTAGRVPLKAAATSGTFSPTLQKPISMAYLKRQAAVLGAEIQVDIRGTSSRAWVQELPFYKRANSV
jgi:glycine cleavage system aminomethyltransferase T